MAERPKDPLHPEPQHAEAGKYMGVGLQFAASIALFLFGGMWLDRRLDSEPWFTIVGVVVGASAGFYSIYRKLMDDQRAQDEARRRRKQEEQGR